MTSADLSTQREQLASELRRSRAALARLQAELGSETTIEVESSQGGRWLDLEQRYLASENASVRNEREALSEMAEFIEERIAFLNEEVETRREAARFDEQNEAELRQRLERGLTAVTRVTDAQRAALESDARLRQALAALADARRQLVDVQQARNRLGDKRTAELLREVIRLEAEIASAESRLAATTMKLAYVGGATSRLAGDVDYSYELTLTRQTPEGSHVVESDLDTLLQPGDVLEYTLRQPRDRGGFRADAAD